MQFGQLTTEGGYLNSECTSAMQKCIRRGLEEEALFWATELDLAGYGVVPQNTTDGPVGTERCWE